MVLVTPSIEHDVPLVLIDEQCGTRQAVEHLRELGHKKVGLVLSAYEHYGQQERNEGYLKYLREYGMKGYSTRVELNYAGGYKGMKRLLSRGRDITAVLSTNDEMAFGAIRAIEESGKNVPADHSVIGYDDIFEAGNRYPLLTTIRIKKGLLGTKAGAKLIGMIEGTDSPPRVEKVTTELVVRDTTAPPTS